MAVVIEPTSWGGDPWYDSCAFAPLADMFCFFHQGRGDSRYDEGKFVSLDLQFSSEYFMFALVGLNRQLSLLDRLLFFPGDLTKFRFASKSRLNHISLWRPGASCFCCPVEATSSFFGGAKALVFPKAPKRPVFRLA